MTATDNVSQPVSLSPSLITVLKGLLKTMRPHQWTKNVIIFAGIVFDRQLGNTQSLVTVTISFLLLCFIAGSVYIINDLVDVRADRQHPRKSRRPIPSGQLPIPVARLAAVIIPLVALGAAVAVNRALAVVLAVYFLLQLLYSFKLKHVVLIDLVVIVLGFLLRVGAGVLVISVDRFSPWLYACTATLALFLIVGKRRQELLLLAEKAGNIRVTLDQYNLPLLDELLRISVVCTMLTYLFYTVEAPSPLVAGTNLALVTVPFVWYGIARYLYLIHVKNEGSAPDELLLKDRHLQISIGLWAMACLVIIYLTPNVIGVMPS
jgi:4-hydroxybenzoate polyprenyltransferase